MRCSLSFYIPNLEFSFGDNEQGMRNGLGDRQERVGCGFPLASPRIECSAFIGIVVAPDLRNII